MIDTDKPIRSILHNGSIDAEVVERLAGIYRIKGDDGYQKLVDGKWVPLRPSIATASIHMAVRVTLDTIGKELKALPNVNWEQAGQIDSVVTDQTRQAIVMEKLMLRLAGAS